MHLDLVEESTTTDTTTDTTTTDTTTTETTETTSANLMDDVSDTTTTTTTETGKTYVNGKYNSPEALEKAYNDLFKVHSAKEIADDVLREKAIERGLFEAVPENYGDIGKTFGDAGFAIEGELDAEEVAGYQAIFKEAGLSQKGFETLLTKFFAPWVAANQKHMVETYKIGITDAEAATMKATLKTQWGENADAERVEIAKWAKANLNPNLFNKPLNQTVEGMTLLRDLYRQKKGVTAINGGQAENLSEDSMELDKQLSALMDTEAYQRRTHPNYGAAQAKADALLRQLEAIKRR